MKLNLSYRDAVAHLSARGPGIRPGIERIRSIVDLLGDPQSSFQTIHLTGTNGKTSTARIAAAILAAHGIKTGVYTSPHLQSIRERFVLTGVGSTGIVTEMITKEGFATAYSYLLPFIETVEDRLGQGVTYFEATTALAYEWMSSQTVDAGVVEVGLGGRWDATNVANAAVAVLTTVGVDHAEFLGSTPALIAEEKSGIIKPGSQVVSGPQSLPVQDVIQAAADAVGAQICLFDRDFSVAKDLVAIGGRSVSVEGLHGTYDDLFLPLLGPYQSINLATAIAATESFTGRALDQTSLEVGLATVASPGRMEVVGRAPLVVIDGAHNPDAARTLASSLQPTFGDRKVTFVIATFADKDSEGIVEALSDVANRMIFTAMESERSVSDPDVLAKLVNTTKIQVEVIETLDNAIDRAIETSEQEDLIVFAGSVHGAGQVRDHLVGTID
ncbi:MAG: folylpolyglutamate synthase/dihydrofolate synthase family protein [Actinomycetota bacterium]|nr:dihydrofolate synthase [Actinomycetota bacterium]